MSCQKQHCINSSVVWNCNVSNMTKLTVCCSIQKVAYLSLFSSSFIIDQTCVLCHSCSVHWHVTAPYKLWCYYYYYYYYSNWYVSQSPLFISAINFGAKLFGQLNALQNCKLVVICWCEKCCFLYVAITMLQTSVQFHRNWLTVLEMAHATQLLMLMDPETNFNCLWQMSAGSCSAVFRGMEQPPCWNQILHIISKL